MLESMLVSTSQEPGGRHVCPTKGRGLLLIPGRGTRCSPEMEHTGSPQALALLPPKVGPSEESTELFNYFYFRLVLLFFLPLFSLTFFR